MLIAGAVIAVAGIFLLAIALKSKFPSAGQSQ